MRGAFISYLEAQYILKQIGFMKYLLSTLFVLFYFQIIYGQSSNISDGSRTEYTMERLEIKSGKANLYHSSIKPYLREDAVRVGLLVMKSDTSLSKIEKKNIQDLFNDNNEWLGINDSKITLIGGRNDEQSLVEIGTKSPYFKRKKGILKHFYKTPANLFEVNNKDFHFRANPILNLGYANSKDDAEPVFLNQRGIEFRGGVDDRIFFYSNIIESQARFANYVTQRIKRDNAVPGAGFFKKYESSVFDITDGYDFLNAQAYLGFNVSEHVGVQLGHGKHFVGNGYRSLLLSDFANNYFYLKFNWRVWRFQLQNVFAELATEAKRDARDFLLPKKYMASHYLDYNVTPNLSIGFFETVVFQRNNQFELQYLNPVILYRTVEQVTGSADNILLGLNGNWNLMNRFQIYGQFILDEFKFNELITDNQGWWANKYGYQAGVKYIDAFGIDQLDLQFETNTVRPYTYSHGDSSSVYSHFNQPLAHPIGANFQEFIGIIKYQPIKNLFLELKAITFKAGESEAGTNWGENILLSNNNREREYGNELFQGTEYNALILNANISYQVFHNCFLDLNYYQRSKDSFSDALDQETLYIGGGLRLNSGVLRLDY